MFYFNQKLINHAALSSCNISYKEVFIIYQRMLTESKRLNKQITHLQEQLKQFPSGKLVCTRNGNRYKWYQSDGHKCTYIPKKSLALAEKLAVKKYLSLSLDDLIAEKRAIQYYLNHHHSDTGRAERLLTEDSEFKNLLAPHFTPLSKELYDWSQANYPHNPKYPEQLIHKSSSGNLLRSKSESMMICCYTLIKFLSAMSVHSNWAKSPYIQISQFVIPKQDKFIIGNTLA